MSYDILIRGGTVYDGSGKAPVVADIAIADGRIVEIGRIAGEAKQVDRCQRPRGHAGLHRHP